LLKKKSGGPLPLDPPLKASRQIIKFHFTTSAPRNISIPQVNLYRPDFRGVKRTTTGTFKGNGRLILYAGITISVPQVYSVMRMKVSAGTPCRKLTLEG